eukprot:TRINITY_DN37611_c0_g1_i1.p1 TRINITY_DN37611_c0_g1~~TRINITY_DN37611_c0_g1_i1.p1  ORF type:complete len:276 (+),score=53.31 TRINITY_DN37611_c0_g1_i1:105-830(+)
MGATTSRVEGAKVLGPLLDLSVGRVRSAYEQFNEICPTPVLWEQAFGELLGCFSEESSRAAAFNVIDADQDGLIDAREMFGALAVISDGSLLDRMRLLFEIYDMEGEGQMCYDEAGLMLRRTASGLRSMTGIAAVPAAVIDRMTKRIWKISRRHWDTRITPDDWESWWAHDAAVRSLLKMFVRGPRDEHKLPTADQLIWFDYAQVLSDDVKKAVEKDASGISAPPPVAIKDATVVLAGGRR